MKKNIIILIVLITSVIPIIVFANDRSVHHQISIDLPEIDTTIPLATNDDYITIKSQKWINETDNYVMTENDVFENNKKYYYEVEFYLKQSDVICELDHFQNSPYSLGGGGTASDTEGLAGWHFYMGDLNDLTIKTGDIKIEDNSVMIKNGKLQLPNIIKTNEVNYYGASWTDSQNISLYNEYQIEYGKTYKYKVSMSALLYKFDSNFEFINNNKVSEEENYELISEKTTIDSNRTSATYEATYRTIKPDKFTVKFINKKNNAVYIKKVDSDTWYNLKEKELNNADFYTGQSILTWNTKADGTGDSFYHNTSIFMNKNYELYTDNMSSGTGISLYFKCDPNDTQCSGESSYFSLRDSTTIPITAPYPTLQKEGYKITKWITDNDVTTKEIIYPGEEVKRVDLIQYPVFGWTIDYYPYWSNNYHTATFHSNDDDNKEKEIYFEDDESLNLEFVSMTKQGYKVVEWTTNPDGTGKRYLPKEVLDINQDIDLYAKWAPINYTIRFNSNGGNGEMEDQTMTYNIESNLNENKFTKENYVFIEWNTSADGKGSSYKDKQSVINLVSSEKTIELYAIYQFQERIGLETDVLEVDFGTQLIDFPNDVERKVTIKNTGNIPLKVELISPSISSIFSYAYYSNQTIQPNQEFQFTFVARTTSYYFNRIKYSNEGTYNEIMKIKGRKDGNLVITKELPVKITLKKPQAISYKTHVQSYGWQEYVENGQMSGTSGEAKRLEGIKIKLNSQDYDGDVEYRTHIQTYGWETEWKKNDAMSGTSGEAKRLEAIEIKLTEDMAEHFDIYYRVHAQKFGWLGWAKNGESAGTAGYAYRLEGIEIVLVNKGETPEGYDPSQKAFREKEVLYRTHVQSFGWQDYAYDGGMSGTSGLGKRLEGIEIKLNNPKYEGGIRYKTHIQSYGWENKWKENGQMSGTSGEAKRLEAIKIELTGEMAKHFDVYYRVHAQHFGWLNWAKNGESSGTAGFAYRLEGIEIILVDKGKSPPIRDNQNNDKSFIENS